MVWHTWYIITGLWPQKPYILIWCLGVGTRVTRVRSHDLGLIHVQIGSKVTCNTCNPDQGINVPADSTYLNISTYVSLCIPLPTIHGEIGLTDYF